MNQSEYESQFESVVLQLQKARQAYDAASAEKRAIRLAELTVLKDKLLELTRAQKQFAKNPLYKAKLPENEPERLKALVDLHVLDTPYEDLFDAIVQLASKVCGTPIALISLIDADRQWFKANVGLPGATETPREHAFCAHAIHSNDIMEVVDATLDARFANNPLVTGQPDIRFYAGAPIALERGEKIGTLCVIDRKTSRLNDYQKDTLEGLANIVAKALLARAQSINALR